MYEVSFEYPPADSIVNVFKCKLISIMYYFESKYISNWLEPVVDWIPLGHELF